MVRPERSAEASASETCGGDAGFKSHDQTRPTAGRFTPATFRGIATLLRGGGRGWWTGTEKNLAFLEQTVPLHDLLTLPTSSPLLLTALTHRM